jgi:hypothetical protein
MRHLLEVEGDGAMVCLHATRYDSKTSFIKYLCHLFLFCCHQGKYLRCKKTNHHKVMKIVEIDMCE